MLSNMACSLILHKRISTTVAKAKALKQFVEPIITKAKEDTTHSRRTAFSYLKQKGAVTELFRTVAPAVGDRPGGYTRILKTGFRLGDGAETCFIELVDFNATYTTDKKAAEAKPKTRRSRSGGTKEAKPAAEKAPKAETPAVEAPAQEAPETPAAEETAGEVAGDKVSE
jgi:large subunit ribosomal protein L17